MATQVNRPEILPPGALDDYLERGWYRIGPTMMTCRVVLMGGNLRSAVWTRVRLPGMRFRKSHRRTLSKVESRFRVEIGPMKVDEEREALHRRYRTIARGERPESLVGFLHGEGTDGSGLFDTREVRIFDGDRLAAFSWFDVGRVGLQSLIGVYDPCFGRYSLGFATMLYEVIYGMENGFEWFYPGYVLLGDPSMDYKLRLGGVERWDPDSGLWVPYEDPSPIDQPAERMREALDLLVLDLNAADIETRMELYPSFELPAYCPEIAPCVRQPLVVLCGAPHRALIHVVSYDVETGMYELQHCVRAVAITQGADGSAGARLPVYKVVGTMRRSSDPAAIVRAVRETSFQ